MIYVVHLAAHRLPRQLADAVASPGDDLEAWLSAVRQCLGVAGAYEVAAGVDASGPEQAALLTTNGKGSLAWNRIPPPGVFPVERRIDFGDTRFVGRSTQAGDIVVDNGGLFHVVGPAEMVPMLPTPRGRFPRIERRERDDEGRRVHWTLDEQVSLARRVAEGIVSGLGRSHDIAEAVADEIGMPSRASGVIAEAARDIAIRELGHRFVIAEGPLARCIEEATHATLHAPPSPDAMREIIEADAELVEKLNDFYPGNGIGGLDTAEREEVVDLVALRYAGQGWPVNMDSPREFEGFAARLTEALVLAGWTEAPRVAPAPPC